jgi:hypothetical protein
MTVLDLVAPNDPFEVLPVGRSDTNEGWTLKESDTYEKRPT